MRLASPHFDRACLISIEEPSGQPAEGVIVFDHPRHTLDDCTFTAANGSAWRAPRQPRIAPRRRSRWGRVLRDLLRFLMSPRAW